MNTIENRTLWNERATLEATAGTQDLCLKRLEQRALLKVIDGRGSILEVGCGLGETAGLVAEQTRRYVLAVDNSPAMIERAYRHPGVALRCCDVDELTGTFGTIYTQRMLINLPSTGAQLAMLGDLARVLGPGGRLVCCESSVVGLFALNQRRTQHGLPTIEPPPHTHYLKDWVIERMTPPGLRFVRRWDFSHTYYVLSRIVNAKLAQWQGREPRYDHWLNRLAIRLPMINGPCAQTKIWIWEKR